MITYHIRTYTLTSKQVITLLKSMGHSGKLAFGLGRNHVSVVGTPKNGQVTIRRNHDRGPSPSTMYDVCVSAWSN